MSDEGFDQGFLGSLNPHDRYSNVYIALEKGRQFSRLAANIPGKSKALDKLHGEVLYRVSTLNPLIIAQLYTKTEFT